MLGSRGGGPGRWGALWLAGVPGALVLAGFHGRGDDVVPASRVSWCMDRGVPLPGETFALWASTAASVDVVPFLKASMGRRLVCLCAPGENPRSSDRAVAAFWRRDLLEDTALEPHDERLSGGWVVPLHPPRQGLLCVLLPRCFLFG